MKTPEEIKKTVRKKYGEIAGGCGCGCGCSSKTADYSRFNDDYQNMDGYVADADLGLGCGLPVEHARISPGDSVLDLGSGAGNDCFVARSLTGENGTVTGVDFTPEMIEKARENAERLGYTNVRFLLGDIENLPVGDHYADVVISNCVLNLVPNKEKAFSEIMRVLRPGGHFCISDVVTEGDLPADFIEDAELYAGCISGALKKKNYLDLIINAGFEQLKIVKEKKIELPDNIFEKFMNAENAENFKHSAAGIFSITVRGVAPVGLMNNYNYIRD